MTQTKTPQPVGATVAIHGANLGAVEQAQADAARLCQQERDYAMECVALAARLTEVRTGAGERIVDGSDSAVGLGAEIAQLRSQLEATASAAAAARNRRRPAIKAVWAAQVANLCAKAATLRAEAAERDPKTSELLAALRTWEGCNYVPAPPTMPSRPIDTAPSYPGDTSARQEGGAPYVMFQFVPRTAMLRLDASALEQSAVAAGRQEVADSGAVEAANTAQLVDGLFADPMRLGPPLGEVLDWADQMRQREQARRARVASLGQHAEGWLPADAPVMFVLVWRRGVIDTSESRIYSPRLLEEEAAG